jgi:hypothetical protein
VSSGKSSLGAASKIGLRDGVLVFLGSDDCQVTGEVRWVGHTSAAGPSWVLQAWKVPSLTLAQFVT